MLNRRRCRKQRNSTSIFQAGNDLAHTYAISTKPFRQKSTVLRKRASSQPGLIACTEPPRHLHEKLQSSEVEEASKIGIVEDRCFT